MTPQPITRPITASTAASHTGTVSEQSGLSGWMVVVVVGALVVVAVVVVVVVVGLGKLFILVKM